MFTYILTGKRNATVELCQFIHGVHIHELHEFTMTRTLSKVCGCLNLSIFVYQVCLLISMDILIDVTNSFSF